jgi:hypothetical protein
VSSEVREYPVRVGSTASAGRRRFVADGTHSVTSPWAAAWAISAAIGALSSAWTVRAG